VPTPNSRARNRFFALSLFRLAGALAMMSGVVIASGRIDSAPRALGFVMVLAGAYAFALLPRQLARRWRTPK
jgi:uncharacterized protein YjeT (DUF2065 family)